MIATNVTECKQGIENNISEGRCKNIMEEVKCLERGRSRPVYFKNSISAEPPRYIHLVRWVPNVRDFEDLRHLPSPVR